MRTKITSPTIIPIFACLLTFLTAYAQDHATLMSPFPKPAAAQRETNTVDYFGTKVTDPYGWMEAGVSNSEFMAYLKSQSTYTVETLASISGRNALLARLHQLANAVPTVWPWQRAGNCVFFRQIDPGASTPSLMVRDANGKIRTLLDPVALQEGGSHASLNYMQASWNGDMVLVGVSFGGSEDTTIHVIDTVSGKMLPDAISRTQYAEPSWRADSKAFYYARFQKLAPGAPASAVYENERVFLHVVGTDPEHDTAVFGAGVASSLDIPRAGFSYIGITPGSKYALAAYTAGTVDSPSLYLKPVDQLADPAIAWTKIIAADDQVSSEADNSITQVGSTLYLLVDKDAPNRKLVSIDLDHPHIKHATLIVPASNNILTGVYAGKDGLYLTSKRGISFDLHYSEYATPSKFKKVDLPYSGTVGGLDASVLEPGVLFSLETWTRSFQIFAYDAVSQKLTNSHLALQDPADFSAVESREVTAISADGTEVPLSIICRKGIVLDGSHPVLYQGYGSYGVSTDPMFDPTVLAWIEHGGVIAIAHVRGGGELGEAWHNAGRKEMKQHTIDDMIAVANYLIQQRYSSPDHLAVMGTSAGGVAIGGAIVQHPELFVAGIDNVGMTDLLNFQKSQGGAANVPEFGDVTQPVGFKSLYAVSPYHHIVDGTHYPAVLAITGVNDPRVPSWMVAKMAARLQAASASSRPVLLRVDFDAGHGIGSSRPQIEQLYTDIMSFILWQSGDPAFQPKSTPGIASTN